MLQSLVVMKPTKGRPKRTAKQHRLQVDVPLLLFRRFKAAAAMEGTDVRAKLLALMSADLGQPKPAGMEYRDFARELDGLATPKRHSPSPRRNSPRPKK